MSGVCVPYPVGCSVFDSLNNICVQCKYSYTLVQGICYRCYSLESGMFDCPAQCTIYKFPDSTIRHNTTNSEFNNQDY